jgi:hypothetical protein
MANRLLPRSPVLVVLVDTLMTKTANAGSTYRGGILGRRKNLAKAPQNPSKTALSECAVSLQRPASKRKPVEWPIAYPRQTQAQKDRFSRLMTLSVIDHTAPLLIDRADAMQILDLGPAQFDRLELENTVIVGARELYRAADIRRHLLEQKATG